MPGISIDLVSLIRILGLWFGISALLLKTVSQGYLLFRDAEINRRQGFLFWFTSLLVFLPFSAGGIFAWTFSWQLAGPALWRYIEGAPIDWGGGLASAVCFASMADAGLVYLFDRRLAKRIPFSLFVTSNAIAAVGSFALVVMWAFTHPLVSG